MSVLWLEMYDCVITKTLSSAVLSKVLREIRDVSEWFHLGASLGLRVHTLETIHQAHADPESCKEVMIEKWLQGMDEVSQAGGPSWQQLADVLEKLQYVRQAQKIKKDYCLTRL